MGATKELVQGFVLRFTPRRVLFYMKAARYIYHLGRFSESEEPDLSVVKYLVKPGDTVVDVGANIGWYTKYVSGLAGEEGKVISLEPIPETFALLSICVKYYGLSNVALFNVGASAFDGSAVMQVPNYASGGANYYMASIVDSTDGPESTLQRTVRLRSLDSLLGELSCLVDFIKCDVEGHELQLIKGSLETIRARRAAWLIEISRSSDPDCNGSNSSQIFQLLETHGYSAWWLDGKVLRRRKFGEKALNYFFLLPKHVSILERVPLELA